MPQKQFQKDSQVLTDAYIKSENFYLSDKIHQYHIRQSISDQAFREIEHSLNEIGAKAAIDMDELSLKADKNSPALVKRNAWGENINRIDFHPAYDQLVDIAIKTGMFHIKWQPESRKKFNGDRNKMSFALSAIYAMAEMGVYCPLCMTDGAAVLIDKFCDAEDRERLLEHISSENIDTLKTGAMYLTEKVGGSDVGANQVYAEHYEGKYYKLNGEKWFCSNAQGEIAFVLARTNFEQPGTQGLSLFLVEKTLSDGTKNPMNIVRLKDKIGVRSMASAEIELTDTIGKLVGAEGAGFKLMTEMINLSRVYNSVAAVSVSRRALIESYQFLRGRITFGKNALEHPLIRKKLWELGANHVANYYLVWRAIAALDSAENNANEAQLLRLLTPMTKKWTAEKGVYMTRESMELMGGIGYIEDQVMPKLMRDIMVLPIWEGAGNIMILDMLRASLKSDGLIVMIEEIRNAFENEKYGEFIKGKTEELEAWVKRLKNCDEETMQTEAAPFFEQLTQIFQMNLLIQYRDDESRAWIDPSLIFLKEQCVGGQQKSSAAPEIETINSLIAWQL